MNMSLTNISKKVSKNISQANISKTNEHHIKALLNDRRQRKRQARPEKKNQTKIFFYKKQTTTLRSDIKFHLAHPLDYNARVCWQSSLRCLLPSARAQNPTRFLHGVTRRQKEGTSKLTSKEWKEKRVWWKGENWEVHFSVASALLLTES